MRKTHPPCVYKIYAGIYLQNRIYMYTPWDFQFHSSLCPKRYSSWVHSYFLVALPFSSCHSGSEFFRSIKWENKYVKKHWLEKQKNLLDSIKEKLERQPWGESSLSWQYLLLRYLLLSFSILVLGWNSILVQASEIASGIAMKPILHFLLSSVSDVSDSSMIIWIFVASGEPSDSPLGSRWFSLSSSDSLGHIGSISNSIIHLSIFHFLEAWRSGTSIFLFLSSSL